MTYWKVTDKTLTGTVFVKFCLSLVGWIFFQVFKTIPFKFPQNSY